MAEIDHVRRSCRPPRHHIADVGLQHLPRSAQQGWVDVQQEPGGIPGGAVEIPPAGSREGEALFRPGQRHEGQPPLLLEALLAQPGVTSTYEESIGATYDEASDEAARMSERDGRVLVPAFNDPRTAAGQATVLVESIEQLGGVLRPTLCQRGCVGATVVPMTRS